MHGRAPVQRLPNAIGFGALIPSCALLASVPAQRRIGGSYATLFYVGGTLMDVMSALNAAAQAVGLIRTAAQTLDEAKIVSATNELNGQLIQLGAEVIAMQKDGVQATERERALLARVHQLEDQVREFERRRAERDRYALVEPYPGTYALRVKEAARGAEPEHHLCPGCLDNDSVKSILQFNGSNHTFATCPKCKQTYRFGDPPPPRKRSASRSSYLSGTR